MKTYFSKLHYSKKPGVLDILALTALVPASFFYGAAVSVRNFLFEKINSKSKKLTAYVISVGNLTTGGTGKTPVTGAIASYIANTLQKKTTVISRGYGGKLDIKNTNVISNGEQVFYNAEMAGDEPFWFAENIDNIAVVTGKNRVKSGQYATDNLGSEVIILDDGFQHRKLKRDLNIALIDGEKVFGNGFLLPAGPLRENKKNIERADKVIIVNKKPFDKELSESIRDLAKSVEKPTFICEFITDEMYDIKTKQPITEIKSAIAFCGIAQPEAFFASLKKQGIELKNTKVFADHYAYTPEDIKLLIKEAQNIGADAIITTEKDAVKIEQYLERINSQISVCALKLRVNLDIENLLVGLKDENTCNQI